MKLALELLNNIPVEELEMQLCTAFLGEVACGLQLFW